MKYSDVKSFCSKYSNCLTRFRCISNNTEKQLTYVPETTTWADTIPFVHPVNSGICIKVYDGDTITIAAKLPYKGSPIYRFSVRLNGIDTPEIKGKTND